MRWLVIVVECLFVFIFIPIIGVNVWESKANSLVQHADVLLGSNPKKAMSLYNKADGLCIGGLSTASNRMYVCEAYGIGIVVNSESQSRGYAFRWGNDVFEVPRDEVEEFRNCITNAEFLYSFAYPDEKYESRTNNLMRAIQSRYFLHSLGRMPRLSIEMERKLWEDSASLTELREVIIDRVGSLANEGVIWAQKELASCYTNGVGVARSDIDAFKWYLKAAEQGDVEAEAIVARCYKDGRGVKKNFNEMIKWLLKAAGHMDSDSAFLLGQCYEEGMGVDQSDERATEWYKKAADQGSLYGKIAATEIEQMDIKGEL